MKFVHTTRAMLAGIALCLLNLGSANAGQIATPVIFQGDGDQLICIANNTTNIVTSVTVRIVRTGGVGGDAQQTCSLAANGQDNSCEVFLNNAAGWCRITVNGLTNDAVRARIRGVLFSRRITSPFRTDSVVQAQ